MPFPYARAPALVRAILRKSLRSTRSMSSAPLRPYKFHVGASWAGKQANLSQGPNAPFFPPDSDIGMWRDHTLSKLKAADSTSAGQDFFFVQPMRNDSGIAFGVSDGVGGWAESGVDPSLFSQALMFHAHRYSRNAWAGEPEIDPTLDYEEREEIEGWEMTPYECLDLAYGGVLREKQLTKLPTSLRRFSRACVDNPNEAETYRVKLGDGDIVIAYVRHELLCKI
ncbi:hypothetical protein C0995_005077 [Termitomyces sp. Mi166|nr:hypothetical protein C0995_005077 [Termitomyces sp. Mi166\